MNANATIGVSGELSAVIIRADGSHRNAFTKTQKLDPRVCVQKLMQPMTFWRKLYAQMRSSNIIPAAMTLAAFIQWMKTGDASAVSLALVTTAGCNYLAADMAGGGSDISAMNYHDSGTGTTAAAIGDTALQTQAGPTTRATGTQTNPTAIQYRSVGTIAYVSTLAITEWGLFSQAAQGGTLWDHRIFSAINVVSGDSCQFTYTLTLTAGGS
jgi:hypothetical protein